MAKAVRRCGEVWLSMAKDVYVEEGRKMKGIGVSGELETIQLSKPMLTAEGEMVVENDLSEAQFDVAVDVGPSSSSRRSATVRALTGMMAITNDPETQQVLQAMAMMNLEGEGVADVREFFRKKLIRMGVVKPTQQELDELMAELEGKGQDPNAIFLAAAAEEAQAKAAKARADVVKTLADADLAQARTIETLNKTDAETVGKDIDNIRAMQGIIMPETATTQPI